MCSELNSSWWQAVFDITTGISDQKNFDSLRRTLHIGIEAVRQSTTEIIAHSNLTNQSLMILWFKLDRIHNRRQAQQR